MKEEVKTKETDFRVPFRRRRRIIMKSRICLSVVNGVLETENLVEL